ncbi:MAG TPA: flagellar hook assembly protein FlgD [Noviherbaspirillum sp.]
MANTIQDSGISSALLDKMNPKKKSAAGKTDVEETQDRFLTLLVTQMKSQDPMNPLDNAQVTSQFAQLSTVTGINKLNDALTAMASTYQTNQTLQAASMINHGVLTPGSGIDLTKGNALLGVDLNGAADKVSVTIRDSSGKVVRTMQAGALETGSHPLAWDGKADDGSTLADGHYKFEIAASQGGAKVSATGLQFGLVDSVVTNAKGVKLNVGSMGPVELADVRQIL